MRYYYLASLIVSVTVGGVSFFSITEIHNPRSYNRYSGIGNALAFLFYSAMAVLAAFQGLIVSIIAEYRGVPFASFGILLNALPFGVAIVWWLRPRLEALFERMNK